jgi:hypothetical protein
LSIRSLLAREEADLDVVVDKDHRLSSRSADAPMDDVTRHALLAAFLEPIPLVIVGFVDLELGFDDISVVAALLPWETLFGSICELGIRVPVTDFLWNFGVLSEIPCERMAVSGVGDDHSPNDRDCVEETGSELHANLLFVERQRQVSRDFPLPTPRRNGICLIDQLAGSNDMM